MKLNRKDQVGKKKLAGLPAGNPLKEGVSPKILKKIRDATKLEVTHLKSCIGVSHIILKNGKCVFAHSRGYSNLRTKAKFSDRTICRLHGATKAIVSAAFLTLVDQKKVKLDDPISKYMPFSAQVSVDSANTPGTSKTTNARPAKTLATVRHLLTDTAGLGYTDCPLYKPLIRRLRNSSRQKKASARSRKQMTLSDFCDHLAKIPLVSEPGKRYEYSFCTDVLGRLAEVISNQPLETFVKEALLKPMGMKDTHFTLPPHKHPRVAVLYNCKATAKTNNINKLSECHVREYTNSEPVPAITSSGGGFLSYKEAGMWGTARDYAKFCQMLLCGGKNPISDVQVLKKSTIGLCWSDGLAPLANADGRLKNWNVDKTQGPPWEGGSWDMCGWSLLSTLLQLRQPLSPKRKTPRTGHSMGVGGGGGVYWLVDAKRKVAALSFQQCFEGGREEDDGLGPPGNDCIDLALEAVDTAKRVKRL